MNASIKTVEDYFAELDADGAAPRFRIMTAREFIMGRPPTPEEQALDDAIDDRNHQRWELREAEHDARERIEALHGEKAARAFDAFRVIEAEEFASTADSEPAWQVRGVIPTIGIGLHPGPSGTLKSFAELELAACIHRGVPFHGRPAIKGRSVLVVAEGVAGYRKRLRAYAKHNGVPLGKLPAVIPAAPNLFEPAQITALIARLKLLGVTYCSLDTKWRMSGAADENSASDQAIVFGSMDRLARELKCFVMAVSHTGRDVSKGARGSSSQYAAVDVELTQERTGDHCTLRVTKNKDFEDSAAFLFRTIRVDLGFNAHGEPESSLVLEPAEPETANVPDGKMGPVKRAVIDYVRASGETQFAKEALVTEVRESLKRSGSNVRRTNIKRTVDGLVGSFFEADGDDLTVRAGLVHDNAGWLQ